MKTLSLVFAITFLSIYCQAQMTAPERAEQQITVGKIAPMGNFIAELDYRISESDTIYTLLFQDRQYKSITQIETVSFSGVDNTAGQLYTAFKSAFLPENKKNKDFMISFDLGEDHIVIGKLNSNVILFKGDSYMTLTESQVDKLLGK